MTISRNEFHNQTFFENFVSDSIQKTGEKKSEIKERKLNEQVKNLIINKQQIGERALFGRESTTEITV